MGQVRFVCRTADQTPVDGVFIRIYNGGGTLITSGTSGEGANPDGERLFDDPQLVAGSYTARFSYTGTGYQIVSPQAVALTGIAVNDQFKIAVTLYSRPIASDPQRCRCSGFFRTLGGAPMPGASLTFKTTDQPVLLGADAVVGGEQRVTADTAGYVSVDLIRGAIYRIELEGYLDLYLETRIPDQSSANLPDLLFPIVSAVAFSPSPVALAVAGAATVAVIVSYRSGLQISLTHFTEVPVTFKTSPTGIAEVIIESGALKVVGKSAGTTVISAERVLDSAGTAVQAVPTPGAVQGSLTVTVT